MHLILSSERPHFETAFDFVRGELLQLRTGRATPTLVENIEVEAYGARTPMKGVASISTPDPKTVQIQPWDKSVLKAIESALVAADLGIQPVVNGDVVRLIMPAMTEENRKTLVKKMKERLEDGKVRMRGVREKAKARILKAEKDKTIAEDEKFKMLEELDAMTREWVEKIEKMGEEKEEEIMTV